MMVMPSKGDGSIRFGRSVDFDERHFACPPCDNLRFIAVFVHDPCCADCSSGATTPLCKYRWKLLRSLTSASQCCQSAPSMSRRASCCDSPGSPPILSTLFLLELRALAWTCFRTTCIPHVCPGSPAPAFRIILQEEPCQNCPGSLCSLRACRCVHCLLFLVFIDVFDEFGTRCWVLCMFGIACDATCSCCRRLPLFGVVKAEGEKRVQLFDILNFELWSAVFDTSTAQAAAA